MHITEQENEVAESLYTAYQQTFNIKFLHPAQNFIREALFRVVKDRKAVNDRLAQIAREGRSETNPKPKVVLLQPQPVATQTQEGQDSPTEEVEYRWVNPNEQQQERQEQSEGVAGKRKYNKKVKNEEI